MTDKTYPWTCGNCAQKRVQPIFQDYCTQFKHDGKLHDLTIPNLEVPTCQNCGQKSFSLSQGDRITQALREKVGLLPTAKIKSERKRLGLNQEQLAECIGAAKESISRWETGALIQSVSTDRLLRMFFKHPTDPIWNNKWMDVSSALPESRSLDAHAASSALASSERRATFFRDIADSVERKLLSRLMVEDFWVPMVESRLKEDDFQNALLRFTYNSMLSIYHTSGKIVPRKLADALAVRTAELPAEPSEIVIFLVDTAVPDTKIEELVDLMSRRSQIRRELSESL